MRLIDADELREYMERHCEFCKSRLRIYEYLQGRCELCPMSQVYALIDPEAGLKTQTRKWIPCSERLPEEGGRYIVTEKRFAIDDEKHKGRYQIIVEEAIFSNNKWCRANFFEVLAWMKLPKPYGEEESE